jgi:glycosyltransferase involved in cell wall biosynthesis
MRILWHSNAPHCSTGYGVQTAIVAPRLQGLGHDIAISANWGLKDGVITVPGPVGPIPVYPGAKNPHGLDTIGPHTLNHRADVAITHYDAWVFAGTEIPAPWCPWFPVDTHGLVAPCVLEAVKHAAVRLVQTRAGQAALAAAGLDSTYVPAMVDPEVYYPDDGSKIREGLGIGEGFLVGMIAANKGGHPCRKAFPQAFDGFARFHAEHPESLLYVHTDPKSPEGLDLVELADHFGIGAAIRWANPYGLVLGYADAQMRAIYNALDVLLSPSMGEGVGVPILEAQACGTPVITGDWTSMSEVTKTGKAISRDDAYPYHFAGYGEWFLANPQAIADALTEALDWQHDPAAVSDAVSEYEVDRVMAEHWAPALDQIATAITPPAPPQPNRAQRRQMKFRDKIAA